MVPRKKSITFLHVDDERSLLELTKNYLESKGDFEVELCNCPEEALGAKEPEWQSFSDIICRQRSSKISIIDELEGLDVLDDPLL